jgi:heme/copper-type cytochrome/quinol oxidase subunit 2
MNNAVRLIILGVCALLAAGVFGAIFVSTWSSRQSPDRRPDSRQSGVAELLWALIPCLMVIGAATPAAIAIIAASE